MYFFLDDRAKRLNATIKNAEAGIERFRTVVQAELQKPKPSTIASTAKTTATKLATNLRSYNENNEKLDLVTKSVSGLLSSFFLPWTSEYKLREATGKNLAKAESKFSKLTNLNLAYKPINNRK